MPERPSLFSSARTVEIPLLSRFPLRLNVTLVTVVFTALLLAVLWISVLVTARALYHQTLERAQTEAQIYNQAFSEHALQILREIDLALEQVKNQYEMASRQRGAYTAQLTTMPGPRAFPEFLNSVLIIGQDGRVLQKWPSQSHVPDTQWLDRPYFRVHRDKLQQGLYVGAPVFNRQSGQWALPITRRLNTADGSFSGVLIAFLNPDGFKRFFKSLKLDSSSFMAMLGDDNIVRASRESDLVRPGETLSLEGFKANEQHITADQMLPGYGLRTVVSLDRQVALQGFQSVTLLMLFLALAGTLLIMIFCIVLLSLFSQLFHALSERRMNEERLSLALAASGLGLCDWDVPSGHMTINRDYAQSLGYKPDEFWLNCEKWTEMLHPEDRPRVIHELGQYLTGQQTDYTCQYRVRGAHGQWHYVEGNARIVERDASGDPLRVLGTQLDVTHRQNAETQLRRLNNTLEARIHDEVAKNRDKDHLMIHQSRMAAMGEMIGNIAHQWRQPLNALGLTLANLRDAQRFGDLTPEYLQEQVAFGEELIRTMSATIEDFRNFYRSNRERKSFSVAQAAQKAVSIVRSTYDQHEIKLEFRCLKDGEVMGVENEYTQALLNLLGNSREAIQERSVPDGQVLVTVDANEQEVWITVTDNGHGIAPDILPKIFDPYFTTRPKGIGIGLYMSKMIMENNFGGRIEVTNTPEGAEFRISTPLADAG